MERPAKHSGRQWMIRGAVLSAATTTPLIALLILMPPGFAGVPYMVLVLAVFLVLFGIVGLVERSLAVNVMVVGVFWMAISVIHLLNPGDAPGRIARVLSGLLWITAIASIHAAAQALLSFLIGKTIGFGTPTQ